MSEIWIKTLTQKIQMVAFLFPDKTEPCILKILFVVVVTASAAAVVGGDVVFDITAYSRICTHDKKTVNPFT